LRKAKNKNATVDCEKLSATIGCKEKSPKTATVDCDILAATVDCSSDIDLDDVDMMNVCDDNAASCSIADDASVGTIASGVQGNSVMTTPEEKSEEVALDAQLAALGVLKDKEA
jgi:hypothetical protein